MFKPELEKKYIGGWRHENGVHPLGLPQSVVDNIMKFKNEYLKFRKGEEGKKIEDRRRSREREIKNILQKENLKNLDEVSLLTLAANLYAFGWWAKKEWLVKTWIEGVGGIENLRKYLEELLYSQRKLGERFDMFRKNVKGMGDAMITEMLAYFNPREYGIWNRRAKEGLLKLGINKLNGDIGLHKMSRLSGRDYEVVINILKQIAPLLKEEQSLPDPDLLDVDYFLYYLGELHDVDENTVEDHYGDHNEIVDMVLNIGRGLGFDVSSEIPLVTGTRVDCVWSARIGNLGELKYVFEVHVKGSIDSLLLNLLKASQDPTVQKVVAVSSENELEKIRREAMTIKGLSDKILFWNVKEVVKANKLVEELMDIMQRQGLTKI